MFVGRIAVGAFHDAIRGRQQDDKTRQYIHRALPARLFQRTFVLADGMQVLGADFEERTVVGRPCQAGS